VRDVLDAGRLGACAGDVDHGLRAAIIRL
jgi:hypothetical protein